MASITFTLAGSQLDGDGIADLSFNPGDDFEIGFPLDTSEFDANLQFIKLEPTQDSSKVNLEDSPTEFFTTTFPDVDIVETNTDGDSVSVVESIFLDLAIDNSVFTFG